MASVTPLLEVREWLSGYPPPLVLFNKSHSGSRMLAEFFARAGVFMGANVNESQDSLDVLELVEYLVSNHYPDYGPLWNNSSLQNAHLEKLIRDVFTRHLLGYDKTGLWGWKLCETTYILPVVDFLFPRARYIHLIRDGRDVAFCDHHGPTDPFWKKIYFNTDRIETWQNYRLTGDIYRKNSHIFNTLHWMNSVMVGQNYGRMLRDRYREVRYEDLCHSFDTSARSLLEFVELDSSTTAIDEMKPLIYFTSIGKYKQHSRSKQRKILDLAGPMLSALGYL